MHVERATPSTLLKLAKKLRPSSWPFITPPELTTYYIVLPMKS